MTLKQQNEITLKRIELQMIEDYFSKEVIKNRKQHGQKSSGQMLSLLKKYNLEQFVSVVWNEVKTKEFEEVLGKLYTLNSSFSVKISRHKGLTVVDKPHYSQKVNKTNYNW